MLRADPGIARGVVKNTVRQLTSEKIVCFAEVRRHRVPVAWEWLADTTL